VVAASAWHWTIPAAKLGNFWRSRPINPDLWFWAKYATGLLILLGVLYLPVALLVALLP